MLKSVNYLITGNADARQSPPIQREARASQTRPSSTVCQSVCDFRTDKHRSRQQPSVTCAHGLRNKWCCSAGYNNLTRLRSLNWIVTLVWGLYITSSRQISEPYVELRGKLNPILKKKRRIVWRRPSVSKQTQSLRKWCLNRSATPINYNTCLLFNSCAYFTLFQTANNEWCDE